MEKSEFVEELKHGNVDSKEFSGQGAEIRESASLTEKDSDIEYELMTLRDELEKSKLDCDEAQERFLRASADLENLRKRSERERADLLKYGQEKLLKDLLPVLDSFENAILEAHQPDSPAIIAFLEGAQLVKKQMMDVLTKHGFEEILAANGESFDPHLHQAIQRIETESVSKEVIDQVFAKGYLLNGRLIRPAMVSVFVPQESCN
jgi:molecular chaperone GrpE